MPPPTNIRALRDDRELELQWPDGTLHRLPFRFLRGRCPCAVCVDENTGVRIIDVDAIPADINPVELSFAGNYALKIKWSDRHDTGLFTWDYLAELASGDGVRNSEFGVRS